MDYELLRMGIIYIHLIACCIAVGSILVNDISMVLHFWKGKDYIISKDHLENLQSIITTCLTVLWCTGIVILTIDWQDKGWHMFENPKLQAKLIVVTMLTLNGFVLHHITAPVMHKVGSLLHLHFWDKHVAVLVGSISGVTWMYAAFLGIARALSWKYSLVEILATWPFLVVAGALFTHILLDKVRAEEANK